LRLNSAAKVAKPNKLNPGLSLAPTGFSTNLRPVLTLNGATSKELIKTKATTLGQNYLAQQQKPSFLKNYLPGKKLGSG